MILISQSKIVKEKQDSESSERKWNTAKMMSKSSKFSRYITELIERGKLQDELNQEYQEIMLNLEQPLSSHSSTHSLKTKRSDQESSPLESSLAKESKPSDSFLNLQEKINKSPFKSKLNQLERASYEDLYHYSFARPSLLTEDTSVEFGRMFKEVTTLGSSVKEKWSKALIDKEGFNIRQNGFVTIILFVIRLI